MERRGEGQQKPFIFKLFQAGKGSSTFHLLILSKSLKRRFLDLESVYTINLVLSHSLKIVKRRPTP